MARTEQERSGCVTGLWSLFRPKKAHKGDNKVHPEAMDAAASKLKVQDRVCEAVSGEAMDAAALKLKELRHEQEQEQEEEQRMKPMKQQLEQEEEQMIKPIKQPLEREDDQEKMKQQENDKPKQEEQRPKPILLPAGGRRPGSRPKMVRFSSSAEDILPDGTRRRSETHLSDGRGGYVEFAYLEAFHKANRWLNQRGKTEKKIRSLEEEKREETEEEKHEEKSWSVSALRILIRLTEQLYEELNGKSSDRERIKRARKMMRLQKMLDRIPSERKPWKKLQSGEVVFVKEAKELYDRAGRDFVAEFKRRQRAEVNDECLFCRNHDGEKMIGRAGANSKTTRPWVYLRREHEQTVLSTSKKREMKLAPSSRSWLQGLVNWRPVLGL
ncbi:cilia- and flagella-associated protein 251 [Selaginella moellendorffii]|uniref:cilia- and flagella-associated protein 251 n=1 Tax=Selaginella moellendorffii TaxID=88036 RepID=UPI000D1C7CA0|nr:cilia- and flagella-associated protein 251 [Selaginella moellendorffii]XP_024530210.1 cilia- and flagella-associated protein 251 [Selaginella moellendorffii]XP_024530211.1 cilia- and flagella-associated protein 251 [Selaginella moellendorffii]|eukprot:XP_024526972.1 cilia- and flagella-associated protein 251 [Selaginella moellendorffii]